MRIGDLMGECGVQFGTSGARGRVADMTDRVCYAYTVGFLQHIASRKAIKPGGTVAIGGDLRPSTEAIMVACARAVADQGYCPLNLERLPTPAVAAYSIARGIPSLMVTGSHIPDDRNGIKFNLPTGEILKEDESGIRAQEVDLPSGLFTADGALVAGTPSALPLGHQAGFETYVDRYLKFFPPSCLAGLRIGLYEHSSVAREAFYVVLTHLGAQVDRLGYSDTFIPVDTEAIRPEDVALARNWAAGGDYDALVSADGDGDRPLISDEHGQWVRGDIAGVLCAHHLGAAGVVTPVSSNTVVEKCGLFAQVLRTRIGSPYVIEGMQTLLDRGFAPVVGYEANGGFLLASEIHESGRCLPALPTRDALLVAITMLLSAKESNKPLSALLAALPPRFTASDRLKEFPTEIGMARLAALTTGDKDRDRVAAQCLFGGIFGPVADRDDTDGMRITFTSGEIAHLRPSGNAPELRAYTEADTPERAWEMNRICMDILRSWRNDGLPV